MDWSDLLILLFFVVVPLLQQLLARRSPADPPMEKEEDQEPSLQWEFPEATPSGEGPDELPRTSEILTGEQVIDREQAEELVILQSRLPPSAPEAVRVSAPVVSLEPLHVERPVTAARRTPLALPETVSTRRYTVPRAAVGLHSREEIRRAILLGEILGPPRSLD